MINLARPAAVVVASFSAGEALAQSTFTPPPSSGFNAVVAEPLGPVTPTGYAPLKIELLHPRTLQVVLPVLLVAAGGLVPLIRRHALQKEAAKWTSERLTKLDVFFAELDHFNGLNRAMGGLNTIPIRRMGKAANQEQLPYDMALIHEWENFIAAAGFVLKIPNRTPEGERSGTHAHLTLRLEDPRKLLPVLMAFGAQKRVRHSTLSAIVRTCEEYVLSTLATQTTSVIPRELRLNMRILERGLRKAGRNIGADGIKFYARYCGRDSDLLVRYAGIETLLASEAECSEAYYVSPENLRKAVNMAHQFAHRARHKESLRPLAILALNRILDAITELQDRACPLQEEVSDSCGGEGGGTAVLELPEPARFLVPHAPAVLEEYARNIQKLRASLPAPKAAAPIPSKQNSGTPTFKN